LEDFEEFGFWIRQWRRGNGRAAGGKRKRAILPDLFTGPFTFKAAKVKNLKAQRAKAAEEMI